MQTVFRRRPRQRQGAEVGALHPANVCTASHIPAQCESHPLICGVGYQALLSALPPSSC